MLIGPCPQIKTKSSPRGSNLVLMPSISARVVAVGKIGTPDRAAEQHVTHERQALGLVDKHDRTRRMPRTVQHREVEARRADAVALTLEPAIGSDVTPIGQTVGARLRGQAVEEELVGPMRAFDGHPA